jgi:hypothetical protein
MQRTAILVTLALALSACRSVGVPADRIVYSATDVESPPLEPVDRLDDRAPAEVPGGLTEPERRRWLDAHPDAHRHVPRPDAEPIHTYREQSSVDDDREVDAAWWAVPLVVGAGYGLYRWSRHYDHHRHHHHHGSHWNISVGTGWYGPYGGWYGGW